MRFAVVSAALALVTALNTGASSSHWRTATLGRISGLYRIAGAEWRAPTHLHIRVTDTQINWENIAGEVICAILREEDAPAHMNIKVVFYENDNHGHDVDRELGSAVCN